MSPVAYEVVIPTIGRPSLTTLIAALGQQRHRPASVQVVHDDARQGPATVRNRGWHATSAPWVVFLDDDVVPTAHWSEHLVRDLDVGPGVGAVTGRIVVPDQPAHPTDEDRATIALERAACVTADLAVRREALEKVDGFDERLPRAYREDTDLALRLVAGGWRIEHGVRVTEHPLRHDGHWWSSVGRQRGNIDDAFMWRRHGAQWRARAAVPRGTLPVHVVATGGLLVALAGLLSHRPAMAVSGAAVWTAATSAFLAHRLPRTSVSRAETLAVLATSIVIPPVAVGARLAGEWRHRHVEGLA